MKQVLLLFVFFGLASGIQAQPGQSARDTAWKNLYRESSPRINNLVHTKLECSFDYTKKHLNGKVWITLQPHFYSTDSLNLDAKGMDIIRVAMAKGASLKPLTYKYDGMNLLINLDKKYKGGEQYIIYIEYTAKPDELEISGSAAITDAKGLYFINADGSNPTKPVQIWTQGETEGTSVWCPTIDRPNQKTTQEFYLTVPDKYVSLSNGKLMSSKKNANGTRTDYWKMDLPHAPYLFFMGVGDYAVIKDAYKGREVSYYVEKPYAPVARKIFGHTPEMMSFFSRITGVEFPWVKYAQMTARDYVSGAMENTTATLHQESAQQNARQLLDGNSWESTIAHELFHQWFGDYVTCESWSNLTLNESFANYSQVLWNEFKYGQDAGDAENLQDMQGYLFSGSSNKDLVRFKFRDKEDMFDAVSYNKGGRILHMLRNLVGDSAFFKALNLFLTTNKFKAAEAHQLRLAFEEVTGKDMNWYFNQWYFGSGHPRLSIDYVYDEANKKVNVVIKQTQSGDKVFRLPMAIDIYNGAKKTRHLVEMDQKEQTFSFSYTSKPDLVNVDGDKILLAEKTDKKDLGNYIHQYRFAKKYVDRREAIEYCLKRQDEKDARDLLMEAIQDPYHGLRMLAIGGLKTDMLENAAVQEKLKAIAGNDMHRPVRASAIDALGKLKKAEFAPIFSRAASDSSYSVAGSALQALARIDANASLNAVRKLDKSDLKGRLKTAVNSILAEYGTEADFDIALAGFREMPLSSAKFESIQSLSLFLGRLENVEKFKMAVDQITEFKEQIPEAFREQTDPVINGWLKSVVSKKERAIAAGGANVDALKAQLDYLNGKMKKGF